MFGERSGASISSYMHHRHGRFVSERAVRPDVVIMVAPIFDNDLRFSQGVKHLTIQTFIAQTPIKAFIVTILPWTARFDEGRFDLQFMQPALQYFSRKFRAVI